MKAIDTIVGIVFLIVLLVKAVMALCGVVLLTSILIENGMVLRFLALMAGLAAIVGVGWIAAAVAWHGFLWLLGGAFSLIHSAFDWWAYTAIPKMGDWLTDGCKFIESTFDWLACTALPKMGDRMTAGWDLIEARVKSWRPS